jgi:hypothetical protein
LFIFRPEDHTLRPWTAVGIAVREVANPGELAPLLTEALVPAGPAGGNSGGSPGDLIFLLAERKGQSVGYAELIPVQTLLYRGVWIESLVASSPLVSAALVQGAVSWAVHADLDEVGMLVPERALSLRETFQATGFESLGAFDWLVAGLPLPDAPAER